MHYRELETLSLQKAIVISEVELQTENSTLMTKAEQLWKIISMSLDLPEISYNNSIKAHY